MTFGVKGTSVAFNGVSHNIEDVLKSKGESAPCVDTQTVEAFRKRGDILGQSRYLGQGSSERGHNFVYGKGRNAKKYGAQEILSGKFSVPPSEKDDADLGKSLTPGFRNIQAPGRTYGCPSIRTDVPKISIAKRSIADSQNYGDDATACELINPHRYAHLVIDSTVYDELRTKDWLFALFKKIGYDNVHNDILEAVFDEACKLCESMSRGRKETTLEVFRSVFNHYLECLDIGQEEQWLVEHGLM